MSVETSLRYDMDFEPIPRIDDELSETLTEFDSILNAVEQEHRPIEGVRALGYHATRSYRFRLPRGADGRPTGHVPPTVPPPPGGPRPTPPQPHQISDTTPWRPPHPGNPYPSRPPSSDPQPVTETGRRIAA